MRGVYHHSQGFINHVGSSPVAGHYTATVVDSGALLCWRVCDDSRVVRITAQQALMRAKTASTLLYEEVPAA